MTVWKHELRIGRMPLIIWTAAIAFLLAVCIVIYPEMSGQMGEISESFAEMGSFSQAFGMDKVNFGEFMGFFAVECGNVLGLGGALFAALVGITSLSKEEKEHTAEFLLTHPNSRIQIISEKLGAVFTQIIFLNITVIIITGLSIIVIGESPDIKVMALQFLAYFVMQIEIASICFGISAFLCRSGSGLGLGIAVLFYFLNIIANLTEKAEFLKYITPFGYTEGADIIANDSLNGKYIVVGIFFAAIAIATAYYQYNKKDIA